jgi:hypothetical protein
MQLAGELAMLDHPRTNTLLPETPRWGLGLTVGVELGQTR